MSRSDAEEWAKGGRYLFEELMDAHDLEVLECCGVITKGTHHYPPHRERTPDTQAAALVRTKIREWLDRMPK